jgi:cysteine desulfurase / selenocysteine lyase
MQIKNKPPKALNINSIRQDFPILSQRIDNLPLVYLDNAATTQKPIHVIERITEYLSYQNSTVRRGAYALSEKSTSFFNEAKFINAKQSEEIIFTKGCTEAINLVASSYGNSNFKPNDEIIITAMEHHANIVPWQLICEKTQAKLKIAPINELGELNLLELEKLINPRTRFLSLCHISNVLGTINPIKKIIELAHKHKIPVLIDGSQAAPHELIDVQDLDCDFYAFSGHKVYTTTGVGVLYGKLSHLEQMPPYQAGGDMIERVSFEKTTYAAPPSKFEAGTPPIMEVIALGAALDYITNLGLENIKAYEHDLLKYAEEQIQDLIPEARIIGRAKEKASLISFVIDSIHPHDIGTILDQEFNISVRVGHHCAQPLMNLLKVPATARASFAFYNTEEEIDILIKGLKRVIEIFKY